MKSEDDLNLILEHLDELPEHLYKYRPFDKCGYGIALAARGEAFFSSAKILNDLFECHFIPVSLVESLEGEKLSLHLEETVKLNWPDASPTTYQRELELLQARVPLIKAKDPSIYDDVIRVQHENIGILSLTEESSSMPMWAHYAAAHSGICVGLRTEAIGRRQVALLKSSHLMMLRRIKYSSEIPSMSIDTGTVEMSTEELQEVELTFYTKSLGWRHEKEIRLIFMQHVGRSYDFGTDAVGEVIIGARSSNANVDVLLNELRIRKSTAIVKRAYRSSRSYGLSFEEIKL